MTKCYRPSGALPAEQAKFSAECDAVHTQKRSDGSIVILTAKGVSGAEVFSVVG
jgi:hypothetical protein